MCDKTFCILKEFNLILFPGKESERMYIEDKDDVNMYFSFYLTESEENKSEAFFQSNDNSHGVMNVILKKNHIIGTTSPVRIGTYGKKSENTGLYLDFKIQPVNDCGEIKYNAFIQFKIKGGE